MGKGPRPVAMVMQARLEGILPPGSPPDHWRDTHLRLEEASVPALQDVSAIDWSNAMREQLLGPKYFPPLPDFVDDTLPAQHLSCWAMNMFKARCPEAGVEVLLHVPGYLHAKTVSLDGLTVSVGSGDWNIRSFSINWARNGMICDPPVLLALSRPPSTPIARSVELLNSTIIG